MANTYTQIVLQFVFAVKNRMSLIQPEWKNELYKYITGIVQNSGHKLIAINGMPDHLHVFIGYKPHQLISDLLQDIKGCSATWINEHRLAHGKFGWQAGYGAFSYSHSQINNVATYIKNQEKHHKKKSFQKEYIEFLDHFNIDYDSRYIFFDIE